MQPRIIIYNTRIQLFSFFALAALFARVLARLEDCRHAPIVIRAWSALAVTVAFAVAITYSLPCTMAAVSAGLSAAAPAPGYSGGCGMRDRGAKTTEMLICTKI
jgi:hypothetical protein